MKFLEPLIESTMENEITEEMLIQKSEELFKRVIESERLSLEEVMVLLQFGVITGIVFINDILVAIDQKGEKAAGKKFSGNYLDIVINSLNSEFYYRTSHFYLNGSGLQIPIQLGLAQLKVIKVIQDLEVEMLYGNAELSTEINQRELSYLFAALSDAEIFHSSSKLLAESLESITNYSEKSLKRVIMDFKKTNGGLKIEEKQNLLKKITDVINSF
jgi:hypothetical protein